MGESEVRGPNGLPPADDDRPLEDVPQLADVARPRVGREGFERLAGQLRDGDPVTGREPVGEMAGEKRNVHGPFPQG